MFGEESFLPTHLRPPQQHQHPPVCRVPAGRYDIIQSKHTLGVMATTVLFYLDDSVLRYQLMLASVVSSHLLVIAK